VVRVDARRGKAAGRTQSPSLLIVAIVAVVFPEIHAFPGGHARIPMADAIP